MKPAIRLVTGMAVIAAFFCSTEFSSAQSYQSRDKDGVPSFSDNPYEGGATSSDNSIQYQDQGFGEEKSIVGEKELEKDDGAVELLGDISFSFTEQGSGILRATLENKRKSVAYNVQLLVTLIEVETNRALKLTYPVKEGANDLKPNEKITIEKNIELGPDQIASHRHQVLWAVPIEVKEGAPLPEGVKEITRKVVREPKVEKKPQAPAIIEKPKETVTEEELPKGRNARKKYLRKKLREKRAKEAANQ